MADDDVWGEVTRSFTLRTTGPALLAWLQDRFDDTSFAVHRVEDSILVMWSRSSRPLMAVDCTTPAFATLLAAELRKLASA